AEDVIIDNTSNVYVTGKYTDTVVIGNDSLKDGGINGNIYVAKYDSSGKVLWVQEGVVRLGAENMGGLALASDPYGNVYLYGTFYDSARFGTNKLYTDYFHPNMFLVKYDSTGKIRWIRTCQLISPNSYIYDLQSGYSRPITIDNAGHIYIGNLFLNGTVKFGPYSLTASHYEDFFLAKYDTAGNVLWAKDYFAPTSSSILYPYSLKADRIGHLYLSGNIQDTANFNGFILTCDTTSEPSFLVKMDTSGNVLCGTTVTNYNDDQNAVVPDPLGDNVFFTGDAAFSPYCYFGSTLVAITANTSEQGILGKWNCGAPLGINNQNPEKQLILYPNPNNGVFQLRIRNYQLGIENYVEVYNMLGEKIYDEALRQAQGDNTIDLGEKSSGVYLYRVISENGNLIGEGKFVIQ
ncbi:MAG TPA: T9SS type A sorting domain-containing protein, partial [Bacteroidia bacterium]|nr:T9SS type A sorting domain-containing protein [Bacteroidia bacterium]